METPNFKLDKKEIIGLIAKEHKIKLSEDDPIFAAITLNEIVLGKYIEAISDRLEYHLSQATASHSLQSSEANRQAEIVVTQAAEYLTKQLNQAADGIAASTSNMLAAQIDAVKKAAGEAKNSRNLAVFAVIGFLTLVVIEIIVKTFH